jgi:prepilin-type N-terminal cleavage/methylation domain-containing protein/prepilin-type processing-associated H-X9-DG protein
MKKSRAFTLVELLVVIGIIALLVGILLPALSAARRQAGAVKCAASLREIGNAFQMYAMDNKGYAPAARLFNGGTGAPPYNIDGVNYDVANGTPPYWFNFLAKYVTKTKVGYAANNGSDASDATKSIFWACPAWTSYSNATIGGTNVTQPGYGMNGFPEYTASYPTNGTELGERNNPGAGEPYDSQVDTPYFAGPGWANITDRWYKLKTWSNPAERALAGDCIFWFMESRPPFNPGLMAGQYTLNNGMLNNGAAWAAGPDQYHETTIDWYRHGVYPGKKQGTADEFNPKGGKISYNILFADGHVSNLTDQPSSYKVVRMKYPG